MIYDHFPFWGVHLMWWMTSILFLIVVFALSTVKRQQKESPLDILTKQYAEGIIEAEEYIKKKKQLPNNNSVDEDFARVMNIQ
jgi:putative membrane protein